MTRAGAEASQISFFKQSVTYPQLSKAQEFDEKQFYLQKNVTCYAQQADWFIVIEMIYGTSSFIVLIVHLFPIHKSKAIEMKSLKLVCLLSFFLLASNIAIAATLKSGTCRGISTEKGYKYVGTYCEDFACTVTTTYMFDSWCPYSV